MFRDVHRAYIQQTALGEAMAPQSAQRAWEALTDVVAVYKFNVWMNVLTYVDN